MNIEDSEVADQVFTMSVSRLDGDHSTSGGEPVLMTTNYLSSSRRLHSHSDVVLFRRAPAGSDWVLQLDMLCGVMVDV